MPSTELATSAAQSAIDALGPVERLEFGCLMDELRRVATSLAKPLPTKVPLLEG